MSAKRDDHALEELLGAYALDACDADEIAEVEGLDHRYERWAA